MESFPSFRCNTKSPCSQAAKIDTSSLAPSSTLWSPAQRVLCLVCIASLEQSASFRQVHGGRLVMHCQLCCSPSPLGVRCVRGTTHTFYPTWSRPDMLENTHTHTLSQTLCHKKLHVRAGRWGGMSNRPVLADLLDVIVLFLKDCTVSRQGESEQWHGSLICKKFLAECDCLWEKERVFSFCRQWSS